MVVHVRERQNEKHSELEDLTSCQILFEPHVHSQRGSKKVIVHKYMNKSVCDHADASLVIKIS